MEGRKYVISLRSLMATSWLEAHFHSRPIAEAGNVRMWAGRPRPYRLMPDLAIARTTEDRQCCRVPAPSFYTLAYSSGWWRAAIYPRSSAWPQRCCQVKFAGPSFALAAFPI